MSTPKIIKQNAPEDNFAMKLQNGATLIMDKELLDKIMYFLKNAAPNECMWYSLIDRLTGPEDDDGLIYKISDLFIPEQIVAAKEVETASPTSMMTMWTEVRTARSLAGGALGDLMRRGRLWGHSHVNMPPRPSHDDDVQWNIMKQSCVNDSTNNPVGMIIFNIERKYTNRIYDPELNIEFLNMPLSLRDDVDYAYVDTALETKLAKKPEPAKPVTTTSTVSSVGSSSVTPQTGYAPHRTWSPSTTSATSSKDAVEIVFKEAKETEVRARPSARKDTTFVKKFLPATLLSVSDISTSLSTLEGLVSQILPDTSIVKRSVDKILQLNGFQPANITGIKDSVRDLMRLLAPLRTTLEESAKYGMWACHYLDTIFESTKTNEKDEDTIAKCLMGPEPLMAADPSYFVQDYFTRQVVQSEELLVFAYVIAYVEKIAGSEAKCIEMQSKYLKHLIRIYTAVAVASEEG